MKRDSPPFIGDVVCFEMKQGLTYGVVVCKYTNGEWGAIIPGGFISHGSLIKHRFTGKVISLHHLYCALEDMEETKCNLK